MNKSRDVLLLEEKGFRGWREEACNLGGWKKHEMFMRKENIEDEWEETKQKLNICVSKKWGKSPKVNHF